MTKITDLVNGDTPLRLDVAARIAFPRGGMTAASLRREAKRGRLVIERVAGKDYTTLNHIKRMRQLCHVKQDLPALAPSGPANAAGAITHTAIWIILDGGRQFSTGIHADDLAGGQQALADYINKKHTAGISNGPREIANIPVADVLNLYLRDVVPKHANSPATVRRIRRLAQYFGRKYLSEINGPLCRQYAGTPGASFNPQRP